MTELPVPTGFVQEVTRLDEETLGEAHPWMHELACSGLMVVTGLRESDVPRVAKIANQQGVREFCPRDLDRWGDKEKARAQLAKKGGRAVFQLIDRTNGALAGYGWTGAEKNAKLPDCQNTFAVRLHEEYTRKGLAAPFSKAIVDGSTALYGLQKIGLETWGSNTGAVKAYLNAGASLVTTQDDWRTTQFPDIKETTLNGHRRDVRLYMQFDRTM